MGGGRLCKTTGGNNVMYIQCSIKLFLANATFLATIVGTLAGLPRRLAPSATIVAFYSTSPGGRVWPPQIQDTAFRITEAPLSMFCSPTAYHKSFATLFASALNGRIAHCACIALFAAIVVFLAFELALYGGKCSPQVGQMAVVLPLFL